MNINGHILNPVFFTDNHRRRIISRWLLDEYAYCLAPGGKLYCITDVADLFEWMTSHCENHPLFKRIDNESDEVKNDPCIACMYATDESKKVSRINGSKFHAVFVRISEKN